MRVHYLCTVFAIATLISAPGFADQNASGGGVVAFETVDLGGGPFDHGDEAGDPSNSTTTAMFSGGFTANHIRFTGTTNSIIAATFGSEADIVITEPAGLGASHTWNNTGPAGTFTTFDFDNSQNLTGTFAGGIDPDGTWGIEFIDTTNDGVGADAQTVDLMMTFEEIAPIMDSNGEWAINSLDIDGTEISYGEFALAGLVDTYDVTLNKRGAFEFRTFEDPDGFVGINVDTEIAIYDSDGILLFENDDDPDNIAARFSALNVVLDAGDYTLAVASFDSVFANGPTIIAGSATGDYGISVTLSAVPEPTTFGFLILAFCGMAIRRRHK